MIKATRISHFLCKRKFVKIQLAVKVVKNKKSFVISKHEFKSYETEVIVVKHSEHNNERY